MGLWNNLVSGVEASYPGALTRFSENQLLPVLGDALDLLDTCVGQCRPKEGQPIPVLGKWLLHRVERAIEATLRGDLPTACVLMDNGLFAIRYQIYFKLEPDAERRFLAGDTPRLGEVISSTRAYSGWLSQLRPIEQACRPRASRTGEPTTSDRAFYDSEPLTPELLIWVATEACREQLVMLKGRLPRLFMHDAVKARLEAIETHLKRNQSIY